MTGLFLRRRTAILAGTALLTASALGAQRTEFQQPQLRSSVEVVRVDVTVVNSHDEPLPGLSDIDFTVVEHGVMLPLAGVYASSGCDLGMRGVEGRRDPAVASFDSRYVLIVDDLSLRFDVATLFRAKRIFQAFVAQLGAVDQAAVVFTSGAKVPSSFSSDKVRLLSTIDGLMPRSGQPSPDSSSTIANSGSEEPSELWKVRTSVATLKQVVQNLSRLTDHRRAVILIGEGVPYEFNKRGIGTEMRTEIAEVVREAKTHDVPVFAFDPGAVVSPPTMGQENWT